MSERTNAQQYALAAAVTLLLFVLQFAISRLGWRAAALLPDFPYDADGLYYRLSLHHVFQMAFALLLMLVLHRVKGMCGFKLAPKYDRRGMTHRLLPVHAVHKITGGTATLNHAWRESSCANSWHSFWYTRTQSTNISR